MAEGKGAAHITQAEIKAGVFLTFCLALFIGMLFVLGNFGRAWRGRQQLQVLFTHVSALRREAPVRYNGMELGKVQSLEIVRVGQGLLARLPVLTCRDLPNLPLSEEEREQLRLLPEEGAGETVDRKTRALIEGRTMVLLYLDLLSDNDTRRFREDDEYRIAGSLMGDSAVEIRTGCGAPVAPGQARLFLGVGGDMYTDLGKSITQVKDILASMAELVGGETERAAIRDQLFSFEGYTRRIESAAGSIDTKLEETWDNMDRRLDEAGKTAAEVEGKVKEIQPKLDSALESARKTIGESREELAKSAGTLREKVQTWRKEAGEALGEWRTRAAEYKESVPAKLHSAREWAERFVPTVDKIDRFCTRADDQLNKGTASTRATLASYVVTGGSLEESTYRLKRWPWSYAKKPDRETGEQRDLLWRRDLARRQYLELRGEMELLRQGLNVSEASDRTRLTRIAEILGETDTQLDAGRGAPAERPGKRRK